MAEFKKALHDALRRLTKTAKHDVPLEGEAVVLASHLSKISKARDAAVSGSDDRLRDVRALEARVRMLCAEQDLLKRRGLTNCDLEVITCRVTDAQGDTTNLETGPHWSTLSLYEFICRNVEGVLVEAGKRPRKVFDRVACNFRQGVCKTIRAAADII